MSLNAVPFIILKKNKGFVFGYCNFTRG